jgi:hypothetical protein
VADEVIPTFEPVETSKLEVKVEIEQVHNPVMPHRVVSEEIPPSNSERLEMSPEVEQGAMAEIQSSHNEILNNDSTPLPEPEVPTLDAEVLPPPEILISKIQVIPDVLPQEENIALILGSNQGSENLNEVT